MVLLVFHFLGNWSSQFHNYSMVSGVRISPQPSYVHLCSTSRVPLARMRNPHYLLQASCPELSAQFLQLVSHGIQAFITENTTVIAFNATFFHLQLGNELESWQLSALKRKLWLLLSNYVKGGGDIIVQHPPFLFPPPCNYILHPAQFLNRILTFPSQEK